MKVTKEQREQILKMYMQEDKSVGQISWDLGINVPDVQAITNDAYRAHVRRVEAH